MGKSTGGSAIRPWVVSYRADLTILTWLIAGGSAGPVGVGTRLGDVAGPLPTSVLSQPDQSSSSQISPLPATGVPARAP